MGGSRGCRSHGAFDLTPLTVALARVADLQAEVTCLRGHKERCEHATLGLLRELLQVRARVQLQASELRQLRQEVQQLARASEEPLEVRQQQQHPHPQVSFPFPGPSTQLGPCCPGPEPPNPSSHVALGLCFRGLADSRPGLSNPTLSSLQFPRPQNQNQMQSLDKRYPPPTRGCSQVNNSHT